MSNLSPAPGVPQTGTKAYVSAALAFVVAFATYYIADVDPFTKKEIVEALIIAAIGSGLAGGGTYVAKNKVTS